MHSSGYFPSHSAESEPYVVQNVGGRSLSKQKGGGNVLGIRPMTLHNNSRHNSLCTSRVTQERYMPDLRKTKLCDAFSSGRKCIKGSDCNFAHGMNELQSTPEFYKTGLCASWKQGGFCAAGDFCRHAHGMHELRARVGLTNSSGPSHRPYNRYGWTADSRNHIDRQIPFVMPRSSPQLAPASSMPTDNKQHDADQKHTGYTPLEADLPQFPLAPVKEFQSTSEAGLSSEHGGGGGGPAAVMSSFVHSNDGVDEEEEEVLTDEDCGYSTVLLPPVAQSQLGQNVNFTGGQVMLAYMEGGLNKRVAAGDGNSGVIDATARGSFPAEGGSPASQRRSSASQGRSPASQGRSPASQGRSQGSQGRSPASQGRSPASQGRSPASQGRSPTSQGRSPTSQGRSPASPARGPASPTGSPPSPARSPPSPARSPASPARSPPSPARSPASPARSPASPARSPASPGRSPASPARRGTELRKSESGSSSSSCPSSPYPSSRKERRGSSRSSCSSAGVRTTVVGGRCANRSSSMQEVGARDGPATRWNMRADSAFVAAGELRRRSRQSVLCIDLSDTKPAAAEAYPLAALVGRHLRQSNDVRHTSDVRHSSDARQSSDGLSKRPPSSSSSSRRNSRSVTQTQTPPPPLHHQPAEICCCQGVPIVDSRGCAIDFHPPFYDHYLRPASLTPWSMPRRPYPISYSTEPSTESPENHVAGNPAENLFYAQSPYIQYPPPTLTAATLLDFNSLYRRTPSMYAAMPTSAGENLKIDSTQDQPPPTPPKNMPG